MDILTRIFSPAALGALLLISQERLKASASAEGELGFGQSHFAPFGTNRVHYVIGGEGGQAVVFIHGWGGNLLFWRVQVPALKENAQLFLVGHPGHGRSDKPQKTDYTMDFFARGVLAVLRDADVSKATLVGHSMGVPVICQVYAQAPEKTSALVAVDGLLRRPKGTPDELEKFIAPFRSTARGTTSSAVASGEHTSDATWTAKGSRPSIGLRNSHRDALSAPASAKTPLLQPAVSTP
jgi:pimeloyl-ACP methyl ester carboxylesterase